MNTNKFFSKLTAWALTVCLLLGIAPVTAPLTAYAAGTAGSPIQINIDTVNAGGSGFTYADNTVTITEAGYYEFTGTTTTNRIAVQSGLTGVNITLRGVSVDVGDIYNACAFDMTGAAVNLTLQDVSTLRGGNFSAGIGVPSGSTLNITSASTGTLNVFGNASSAGIGGTSISRNAGTINIAGGTINSNGGIYGAGIGGGNSGSGGTVSITGGIVTSTGGASAAGIGGANSGDGGTVSISGGTVIAQGGSYACGIGRGHNTLGNHGGFGSLSVTGGSLRRISGGASGVSHETQAQRGGANLYQVRLEGLPANTLITAAVVTSVASYGIKDVYTDDSGYGYFWLPIGVTGISVTANGVQYVESLTMQANNDNTVILIPQANVVQVTGITGIPNTISRGTYMLAGTVEPSGATNKTIVWSVANAGTTGASISGNTLTAAAAGALVIRATVYHGLGAAHYTKDFNITVSENDLSISGGTLGTDYTFSGGVLTINSSRAMTVTGTTTTERVAIASGITANITINGLNIDTSSGNNAFELTGTAKLNLTLTGDNFLQGGIYHAGLLVPNGTELTITAASTGSLTAKGGGEGAGIGADVTSACGSVTIHGGTVTATGSQKSAGIGGRSNGNGGTITITGGTIIATGGQDNSGAGIGAGGNGTNNGTLVITGGSVRRSGNASKEATATNGSASVYLTTLTVGDPAVANADITMGMINGVACTETPNAGSGVYGIKGVKTDGDGKLYYWLTAASDIDISMETGGLRYAGTGSPNAAGTETVTLTEAGAAFELPDTDWYNAQGGDGQTSFNISTAAQLAGLAQMVNAGNTFANKTVNLTADIDLAAYLTSSESKRNWIPIGRSGSIYFSGVFDGNNHTVSGLYINDDTLTYAGLFGYSFNATVRDLRIEDADITGANYVGGVTGCQYATDEAGRSIIQNCRVNGTVKGAENVGGITGYNAGAISNSSARGKVEGNTSVGGISGYISNAASSAAISNCYSMNDVTATGDRAGGILGYVYQSGVIISNCYATGAVSGASRVGGILGEYNGHASYADRRPTIRDCTALNISVTGTSNVARITTGTRGTRSNNIAFAGMIVTQNGSVINASSIDSGSTNGLDTSKAAILADGTLGGRFANDGNPWTSANSSLPGFGAALAMPEHLLPMIITSETLPDGTIGDAYSMALETINGISNNWSISGSALPTGLSLNAATGEISGIPTARGTFPFTVTAANQADTSAPKELSITVEPHIWDNVDSFEELTAAIQYFNDYADDDMTITVSAAIDIASILTITNTEHTLTITGETLNRGGTGFYLLQVDSGAKLVLKDITFDGQREIYSTNTRAFVYVYGGELSLTDGVALRNNRGFNGGGVYVNNNGSFNMSGGEISGNTTNAYGGGVYVEGSCSFTMTGGEISGNTATYGGGVYVNNNGSFTMTGGEISGNTATTYGGGVNLNGQYSSFIMTGGGITGNTATTYGGGVRAERSSAFAMSGGLVYGQGANADSVVSPSSWAGPNGNGIVIRWSGAVGAEYPTGTAGTAGDIHVLPATGAAAYWTRSGGKSGIAYENSENTGFISVAVNVIDEIQDNADIAAAKDLIEGASFDSVAQAELNTEEAAKTWLVSQLNAISGMSATGIVIVKADITISDFSAATAGTVGNTSGTNGSFRFVVNVKKDAGTPADTTTKSGTITATAYDPTQDNADISTAKGLIEASAPTTVAQATANTEKAAKTWLVDQLNAISGMSATGITVAEADITISDFIAATAGTIGNTGGSGGSFSFVVNVKKGAGTPTDTASKGMTITATAYDPTSDNDAISTAKDLIEAGEPTTVAQATANTEEAAKTWLVAQLNALSGMSATGITVAEADISISGFSAATARTVGSTGGTNGSFSFVVNVKKSAGTPVNTASKSVTIMATEYDPTGDNDAISTAKVLIETSAPTTVAQATVSTEEAAKTWLVAQLNAIAGMSDTGITITDTDVTISGFSAAAAGTVGNTSGSDGSFRFVVNVKKGAGTPVDTASKSVTITATPFATTYMLTVSASVGGTVSGTSSGSYAQSYSVSVIATANSGYHFTNWTVSGATITDGNTANPAAFSMPTNVVTLTANFELDAPTVTNVTVSPSAIEVQKGSSQQFAASVEGMNNPATTVTWTIDETGVTGTSITSGGALTVASNETATMLTIRATSTVDGTKSGTAIVTVTDDTPTPVYSISLDVSGAYSFPSATENYGDQTPLAVTVTNTGNEDTDDLTVGLSGDTAVFTVSKTTISDIAVGGNDSFTVTPNTGLVAATYTATVTVSGGNGISEQFDVCFTVDPATPIGIAPTITTTTLPGGTVGTAYNEQLTATGDATITWDMESGTLPGGLSLSSGGVISGTPTAAGTFNFTVKAANGVSPDATMPLSIIISNAPVTPVPPVITTATLPSGTVNATYSQTLTANGDTPITWSIASGTLPGGLSLSSDGVISGTPTAAGTFNFTVKAANGVSPDATTALSIIISNAPVTPVPPVITTATLPNGTVNAVYSQTLTANGDTPITWSIASGTLPGGLSLSSGGVISGTPTAAGTFNFTVKAVNGVSPDATMALSIIISNASNGGGNSGSDGGSSSGGSSYTPPASNVTTKKQPDMPTVANVSVTGTVRDNILTTGIITEKMAKDAITAAGSNTNGIAVQFNVTGSGNYVSLTATFERTALEVLKTAGVTHVQIGSDIIDLTLDTKTITGILAQTTGNITVTATRQTNLSDATKALIGNRPVFDITIKDGNGVTVSDLKGGTATIGIPYKPNSTEKTGSLFGVYVDGSGNPTLLINSSYDNGRVIFGRSSLSVYGIGYKALAPAFTDTTNHWAKDNIDFVASRDLISGTTATTFSPDTAITRADFLMALGRLSGADVSGYTTSSFTDVTNTNPAMPYIEWAVQNKIVQGTGNNQFGPDRSISRQDMAVIMVNYARATGYTLPVSRQAVIFADDAKISAYAKDAVKAIQQTGVISGKQNNLFDPQGNTTRAEASTFLRRFVELVIDEGTARGWVQNDSGQWQYINTSGKAVTGLLDRSGNQYWFDDNGVMAAGKWVQISGKWYYFGTDGKLTASGITSPRTGN